MVCPLMAILVSVNDSQFFENNFMNYQIYPETLVDISGGRVIFQSLIFSLRANVRKIDFYF